MKKKSLYIYKTFIAKISKFLKRIINNNMFETHVKRTILKNENFKIFIRFNHWIYVDFYKIAKFSERAKNQIQQKTNEKINENIAISNLNVIVFIYLLSITLIVSNIVSLSKIIKKIHVYDNLFNFSISKKFLNFFLWNCVFAKRTTND